MVVDVWQRVMDLAKAGTSGMDTQDEFNGKMNSAQKILEEALIDVAEINQKSSDALSWLKVPSGALISASTGAITMPADYLHLDTLAFINSSNVRFPATKLRTDEIEMTRSSPIRAPNLTTNDINYYFKAGGLYVMPEQAGIKVDFLYYKKVPDASITLTPVGDDDGDLVTPSVDVELGWPLSVQNLLIYLILEQFGVEIREEMLYEYSQFGITREMIKPNAQ